MFHMSTDRITRINELLKREIGETLFQIMSEKDFDLSAVTVTRVVASRDLRTARVLISIRDYHDQRDRMVSLLRKRRAEIQRRISKNIVLKYTPRLLFELDSSLEKGDHVLSLLAGMEQNERDEKTG